MQKKFLVSCVIASFFLTPNLYADIPYCDWRDQAQIDQVLALRYGCLALNGGCIVTGCSLAKPTRHGGSCGCPTVEGFYRGGIAHNPDGQGLQSEIKISCASEKSADCFTKQESLYKKLGCNLTKSSCEKISGSSLCTYNSDNCHVSADNKSCESDFSSRWLDGKDSTAVCIKSSQEKDAKGKKGTR